MSFCFKSLAVKRAFSLLLILGLVCFLPLAYAETTGPQPQTCPQSGGIDTIACNVIATLTTLINAIGAAAYVAGIAFSIGAIMKFKQHKDNPTQIPVGTPIALLFIAAALIFLPTIITVTGKTIFGSTGIVGGPGGEGTAKIPGQFDGGGGGTTGQ